MNSEQELVKTRIHEPGLKTGFVITLMLFIVGVIVLFADPFHNAPDIFRWLFYLVPGLFIFLGGAGAIQLGQKIIWPAYIQHTSQERRPDLAWAPVVWEGQHVIGRATHELIQDHAGWKYGLSRKMVFGDKLIVFGFGIPFLIAFAALLSWMFYQNERMPLPTAIASATAITVFCGVTTFLFIGLLIFGHHGRLCLISIPNSESLVEVEFSPKTNPKTAAITDLFLGKPERIQLRIRRDQIDAVQLGPWNYVAGDSSEKTRCDAVQGVLVLRDMESDEFQRLPILLTMDYREAAKLMRDLAVALQVPFFFYADAQGWQAELHHSQDRPPLKYGGVST